MVFCWLFEFSFSLFGPVLGNQFLFSCFKHVLGKFFPFILALLSFFSAILRCALLCYCSGACFLGYLVNQLFYIFEHLFILVEDRLVKILSFCGFVSPGDVAFLLKRGT